MKNIMDKYAIINLKLKGNSNRSVAKLLGIDRKTVAAYWNPYLKQSESLNTKYVDTKTIQEEMVSKPKYNSSNRVSRKYTIGVVNTFPDILLSN